MKQPKKNVLVTGHVLGTTCLTMMYTVIGLDTQIQTVQSMEGVRMSDKITRSEWEKLRGQLVHREGISTKVLDTLENSITFAPGYPTPYELDKWTAKEVMGWFEGTQFWYDKGTPVVGTWVWQPTRYLSQAVQVAEKLWVPVGLTIIPQRTEVVVDKRYGITLEEFDEEKVAHHIVRSLYEREHQERLPTPMVGF